LLLIHLFIIFFLSEKISCDDEFDGSSVVQLEHSFDGGVTFTKRGSVVIRSLKLGVAQYIMDDDTMSTLDIEKLKDLVRRNGNYRLRVLSKTVDGSDIYVSTFLKACLLYESTLTDFLTINYDQSGNILGLALSSSIPYCKGFTVRFEDLSSFNTNVYISQTTSGPVPETQIYVQKLDKEKAEKAKGQQSENKSFFARYWMYIVPLLIFFLFASSVDQNQSQGNSAGGGR